MNFNVIYFGQWFFLPLLFWLSVLLPLPLLLTFLFWWYSALSFLLPFLLPYFPYGLFSYAFLYIFLLSSAAHSYTSLYALVKGAVPVIRFSACFFAKKRVVGSAEVNYKMSRRRIKSSLNYFTITKVVTARDWVTSKLMHAECSMSNWRIITSYRKEAWLLTKAYSSYFA